MFQLSFVEFKKGSYVLVDGADNNDRFYIIQSGRVNVFNTLDPGKNSTKILSTGDFLGVIPCMACHAQMENAIAVEDTKAIAVTREQYPSLIESNVPIAMKIIRTFSNRMREMNEQLAQLTLNNVSSGTQEQIFKVAEYYDKNGLYDIASYAYYSYLKECPQGIERDRAKKRFAELKSVSHAVYYEPTDELVRDYPKGTMIMAENQTGSDLFVIQEGQVKISKVVNGKEMILSILKKGDMFGEMALLENKTRSASAIAQENCKVMVVNQKNFNHMVSIHSQLISRLTITFADRLWAMYRQLSNTRFKEPLHKAIDMLSIQLEKDRKLFGSYQTAITFQDLIDMCAIPQKQQPTALTALQNQKNIRLVHEKIFIPDCQEIIKLAAIFKKQEAEKNKSQQKRTGNV